MSQSSALDHWSCVGTSDGLLPQAVQRAQIGDHDLAVWRGADGRVRAWQNRCPHRGMRLSFGFVRGDRLTCLYHGWTYDGQGSCVAIPAHPRLTPPKTITVASYDCVERAGLLWVASRGNVDPFPDIDGEWHAVRSIRIDVPAAQIVAAIRRVSTDPLALLGSGSPGTAEASLLPVPLGNALRIDAPTGGRSLLCAVQPVAEEESSLHLSLAGEDASAAASRRAASEWAKRLRHQLEAARSASVAAAA